MIVGVAMIVRMHVFDTQVPVHVDMHEIIHLQKRVVGQDQSQQSWRDQRTGGASACCERRDHPGGGHLPHQERHLCCVCQQQQSLCAPHRRQQPADHHERLDGGGEREMAEYGDSLFTGREKKGERTFSIVVPAVFLARPRASHTNRRFVIASTFF